MKKTKSNPVMKSAKKINNATNKRWQMLEESNRYKNAVAVVKSRKATSKIKDELLDGIFLDLNERNQDKSWGVQKRVLRRIVEKRQAQVSARVHGSHVGRYVSYQVGKSTRKCLESINRSRHALWA